MKQVVVIHGGMVFENRAQYFAWLLQQEFDLNSLFTRRWKSQLPAALGEEYQVIAPSMPNAQFARYSEWKTWFEKVLEKLDDELILVGHSLGGIFLAKYLATESLRPKVHGTFLVAPVYDEDTEGAIGDFELPEDFSQLHAQAGAIHLFHSTDDPVVPIRNLEKYRAVLPHAQVHLFEDRGHFNQETFPELVELIRSL